MPITNYYTLNGQIVGEKTTGGPRVDYLTDALGSVTATVDSNAQIVNTYRYKPYGAQLAKSGAGADPKFRWVGSLGYRLSQASGSELYVRARHYSYGPSAWTTVEPVRRSRLKDGPYAYCSASPSTRADPSGLLNLVGCGKDEEEIIKGVCSWLDELRENPKLQEVVRACMTKLGFPQDHNRMLDYLRELCKGGDRVCIFCVTGTFASPIIGPGLPAGCEDLCKSQPGQTLRFEWPPRSGQKDPGGRAQDTSRGGSETVCRGDPQFGDDDLGKALKNCMDALQGRLADCDCIICLNFPRHDIPFETIRKPGVSGTLMHELQHCSGLTHLPTDPKSGQVPADDYISALGCCLCKAMFGNGHGFGEECSIPCGSVRHRF